VCYSLYIILNQHPTKGTFTVCLLLKKQVTHEQIKQLENTLIIWGLLGGLGSRARRGFGSVAIQQLNEQSFKFKTADDYFKQIRLLIEHCQLAPEMPLLTALNNAMQIAKATQGQDAKQIMNKLGMHYKNARKEAGAGWAKLPFGLPLAGNRGTSDNKNRRSSPLLMHIHLVAKQYIAIVSFIPADFHPEYYPKGKTLEFYQPLQDYINTMERIYP